MRNINDKKKYENCNFAACSESRWKNEVTNDVYEMKNESRTLTIYYC